MILKRDPTETSVLLRRDPKLRPNRRKMDMKKRVSLELRHRSPAEVSSSLRGVVYAL